MKMYPIKYRSDGNGGGWYEINGRRIRRSDRILVNGEPVNMRITRNSIACGAHNDTWTAYSYDIVLTIEYQGFLFKMCEASYKREAFSFAE